VPTEITFVAITVTITVTITAVITGAITAALSAEVTVIMPALQLTLITMAKLETAVAMTLQVFPMGIAFITLALTTDMRAALVIVTITVLTVALTVALTTTFTITAIETAGTETEVVATSLEGWY